MRPGSRDPGSGDSEPRGPVSGLGKTHVFNNLGGPMLGTITKDKLLFAGSETGMIELDEKKIISKGRLGPGEIIGIRINKGKVFNNIEIKNYLAKEFKHFNNQIVDLDKKIIIFYIHVNYCQN